MAKERFILRYRGQGPGPDDDVARVRELEDAVVVDTSPRMLLVESEPKPLRELVDALPDWVMGPERTYAVPDTRKKVQRRP
jgi:hypothetical protein